MNQPLILIAVEELLNAKYRRIYLVLTILFYKQRKLNVATLLQ